MLFEKYFQYVPWNKRYSSCIRVSRCGTVSPVTTLVNTSLFYLIILFSFGGMGLIVFITLFFFTAPYGRHKRDGWGLQIGNKLGWIIMESISPAGVLFFFIIGGWKQGVMPWIFLVIWMTHYIYRSFIFTALIRGKKTIPLAIVSFAVIFNAANAYLQGRYLFSFAGPAGKYALFWLSSPQFILGILIFFTGFIVHTRSDQILRNLRNPGESEYKIPKGWLFKWISCPNYLGEVIQWIGWAVLTWSLPGMFFAMWTFFNLFPRALANHKWYSHTFKDYPSERLAFIPRLL